MSDYKVIRNEPYLDVCSTSITLIGYERWFECIVMLSGDSSSRDEMVLMWEREGVEISKLLP